MAVTQADVDALKRAISRGAAEVQVGGERVRYQSVAEMRRTLADMEAELRGENRKSFRIINPVMTRGLD